MSADKHIADLIEGFRSFKFVPMPIAFSTNNANPKLILHPYHIEYKAGLFTQKLTYEEIEKIDVYIGGKRTNNIILYKSTGIGTFIGNFRDKVQLKEFLQLGKKIGCVLTEKAIYISIGFI